MGLLELPPELRLQIFSHLPDLSSNKTETIGPNIRLTPAICRSSHILRYETLPLYAQTSTFIIQTDDNNRVNFWLDALDPAALPKVQSLQLSRHWKIGQPSRWQGHIGFYVRLLVHDKAWQCTAGTYPIANDMRGMRLESVELLRHIITQQLPGAGGGLERADVDFVVQAMEIVASHPISTFDTEQSEAGRQRRRERWVLMERKLWALTVGDDDDEQFAAKPFFTPY